MSFSNFQRHSPCIQILHPLYKHDILYKEYTEFLFHFKKSYIESHKKEGRIMDQRGDSHLGTASLTKLVISMAVPAMTAQIINVLYNIVDRIYIGRIEGYGSLALTGVGVCSSIIVLIGAFTNFSAGGGAPLAAMNLGKKNYDKAEEILGTSAALLLCFSFTLTTILLFFREPILLAFGASENTIEFAMDYLGIYLIGIIFVQFSVGLNTFISAQGKPGIAMLSVSIGAIINIILDPILIFWFGLGVKGAAIATIFSQFCSMVWVLRFLTSNKSAIRLQRKNIRLRKTYVIPIAALGISPFIMASSESFVQIILNTNLLAYGGDLYVGAMSILISIMQFITLPINGMAAGIQPIISYNFGAGNRDRVIGTIKRLFIFALSGTVLMGSLVTFNTDFFAGLFTTDSELLSLTSGIMSYYYIGVIFFGILMTSQGSFLALGQAKKSLCIALLRKVFLLVPLAIILPKYIGVMGIYYAEPIADVIAITISSIVFLASIRKILDRCEPTRTSNTND